MVIENVPIKNYAQGRIFIKISIMPRRYSYISYVALAHQQTSSTSSTCDANECRYTHAKREHKHPLCRRLTKMVDSLVVYYGRKLIIDNLKKQFSQILGL